MSFPFLPFDVIIEIARTHWKVWYKISISLREFGLYSIQPNVKTFAQRHFRYEVHTQLKEKALYGYLPLYERYTTIQGIKHGVHAFFYDSKMTQVKQKVKYIDELKEGPIVYFSMSGTIEKEAFYVNNMIHGTEIGYFDYMKKSYERVYNMGKLITESFFHRSGNISRFTNYSNGMKNGVQTSWSETGVVESICFYKDNLKHGPDVSFGAITGQFMHLTLFDCGNFMHQHLSEWGLNRCQKCKDLFNQLEWLHEFRYVFR